MTPDETAAFLHARMKAVYGYCLRRCAIPQDAEDTAQEILLRACLMLQSREDARDPERLLWTIARNTLASHYRSRARCTVGVPADAVDGGDFQADLLRQEEVRRLYDEVARLSRQQREIVVLHYFHRMKQTDVAAALRLPVGTVKWHLHEAKKELKEHMETTRPMEHLKFDPVRFSSFGTEGSIGPEGSPWRVFRSTLAQNITYACWRRARTAQEIADALGVSPVYIEDEAARMADGGYLSEEGGRYRCTILLTEWTEELIRLSDAMYLKAAELIAPALAEALSPAILADESILRPEGSSRAYALWALIPWMIASQPGGPIPFHDAATLRPDGACNLCHAAITPPDVPQPALASRMERFCGPCWNEWESLTLWQIDTVWSQERIGEMYQATESQIIALLRRMLFRGETLSEAEYALLVQRGVLRAEEGPDRQFCATVLPLWLRGRTIRDRLTALAQSVFDEHRDALEALRAPLDAALMADTPAHLRTLRRYMLQGVFHSDRFILHCLSCLVDSGALPLPTEAERASLHTILLTD